MLFTSVTFYFYFLPIFLILFRLVSKTRTLTLAAKIVLIVGTYIFYSSENSAYLIPFIFATVLDLLWGSLLRLAENGRLRRLIVTLSVLQNLSLFFIFKYLNNVAAFFPHCRLLQTMQSAFADTNGLIPLPPGISFYLFESLSFVVDCYREKVRAPRNPINFLVFISMFPRFIAGPIIRYADLEDSINNYKGMRLADGLFVFALGFLLKVLLADSLDHIVSNLFGVHTSFYGAWAGALAYTFQLYIDFSGYSLMAIGLGMTLGFPFADNFREPYLAKNVTDFWRRWHISLSTWLRDYLYVPLGGNRKGATRTQLNLFLTMFVGGIWHGAALTFVFWGAYHGTLLVLERELGHRFAVVIKSRVLTLLLIVVGWVFFRAVSFSQALLILRGMAGLNGNGFSECREVLETHILFTTLSIVGIFWALMIEPKIRRHRAGAPWINFKIERVSWPLLVTVLALFLVATVMSLSAKTIPFLYFQF